MNANKLVNKGSLRSIVILLSFLTTACSAMAFPTSVGVDPGYKAFAFNPNRQVKYYLVNSLDTLQRVELKSNYAMEFYLFDKQYPDDSKIDFSSIWYNGFLAGLGDSSITIDMWEEYGDVYFKNGDEESTYKDYFMSDHLEDVPISRIEFVEYTSKFRGTMGKVGGVMGGISMITMLLVAPLVSIDYKDGGFNSDRYFIWAGAGLGGLVLSIPLLALSSSKTYGIVPKGTTSNSCSWYFEKEVKP